jgi:putative FmdB family regulatory protein
MPLYEYQCDACGCTFEKIQKFSDPPLAVCGKCGKGPIRKLISSPAIQFKGSGWYITDYAKKSSSDAGTTKPADKSDTSESTKKTESAPKSDTPKSST